MWAEEGEAAQQWEQIPWGPRPSTYGVSQSAGLGLIDMVQFKKKMLPSVTSFMFTSVLDEQVRSCYIPRSDIQRTLGLAASQELLFKWQVAAGRGQDTASFPRPGVPCWFCC